MPNTMNNDSILISSQCFAIDQSEEMTEWAFRGLAKKIISNLPISVLEKLFEYSSEQITVGDCFNNGTADTGDFFVFYAKMRPELLALLYVNENNRPRPITEKIEDRS